MNRLQIKGLVTLIFIPLFLLFIGVAFCASDAKAQEPELTIEQEAEAVGIPVDEYKQAKADAARIIQDPVTRSLLIGTLLGTQSGGLNEFYGANASLILSRHIPPEHPVWADLDKLNHDIQGIDDDMKAGTEEMLINHGLSAEEAAVAVAKADHQYQRSVTLMRAVAEAMDAESKGGLTPETGVLIIPEMEPGR